LALEIRETGGCAAYAMDVKLHACFCEAMHDSILHIHESAPLLLNHFSCVVVALFALHIKMLMQPCLYRIAHAKYMAIIRNIGLAK
jgi:hypothetical protein